MARKYQFQFAKDGPPVDEHFLDFIDGMFSQLNIDPGTAQHMARMYQNYVGQRMASEAASAQRAMDGLKGRLGNRFDEHIAAGRKAALSLGLSAKTLDAIEKHIGMAPVAELLSAVGQRIGSPAGQPPQQPGQPQPAVPLGMSSQDALAEISRLRRDPEFAKVYLDKRASGHTEAVDKMTALHSAAYPVADPAAARADATADRTAEMLAK